MISLLTQPTDGQLIVCRRASASFIGFFHLGILFGHCRSTVVSQVFSVKQPVVQRVTHYGYFIHFLSSRLQTPTKGDQGDTPCSDHRSTARGDPMPFGERKYGTISGPNFFHVSKASRFLVQSNDLMAIPFFGAYYLPYVRTNKLQSLALGPSTTTG